MKNKTISIAVVILAILMLSIVPVYANEPLVGQVDTAMQGLITIVRQLALVGAVVLIVFIGISMMFGGSAQNLAQYKAQAVMLIIALLLIFRAEDVVSALQAVFGFTGSR